MNQVSMYYVSLFFLFAKFQCGMATYQYLQLVFQYQPSVCAFSRCEQEPDKLFTVHGIWPSNFTGTEANCQGTPFDRTKLSDVQVDKLNQIWPNVLDRTKNSDFWGREWNKHGRCAEFDDVTKVSQVQYFDLAIKLATTLSTKLSQEITPDAKRPLVSSTSIELTVITETRSGKPVLRCKETEYKGRTETQLVEIVFCVDKITQKIVSCTNKTPTNCEPNVLFF